MADNLPMDSNPVVFCDMCVGEDKKPAQKTCMKCEISMCVHHLQAHLTTPVLLQTHPLVEPMTSRITKCPQHGKLLEYYCLDDMICVCVSCAIEDQHRLHNMKTFATARKDLTEKLNVDKKAVQAKITPGNMSLTNWENRGRSDVSQSSVRLIEAVTKLRDNVLTRVQSSVSARLACIKTSMSSINVVQKEKDDFQFLQIYSEMHQKVEKAIATDMREGLEPGEDYDKLVQEIHEAEEKIGEWAWKFCGSLLRFVDPLNHQEDRKLRPDLVFDPQYLGTNMSLSGDKKRVFYRSPHTPLEFPAHTLVIQGVSPASGTQRWMLSLTKQCDWSVGLCNKESHRSYGHVYRLCYQNGLLTASHTQSHDQDLDEAELSRKKSEGYNTDTEQRTHFGPTIFVGGDQPEKVEIEWNLQDCLLSFFDRSTQYRRTKIHTLIVGRDMNDLIPFARLGKQQSSANVHGAQMGQFNFSPQNFQYNRKAGLSCTEIICELLQ